MNVNVQPPVRSMRILLVDDDPVQRQLASVALKFAGQSVVAAESGAAALALLADTSFDIALFDHDMPGKTGLQLLMDVRRLGLLQKMPVIFATSRDDMALIDRAFELGASGFVTKPVNWTLMKHQLRFVQRAAENEQLAVEARDAAVRFAATKDQILNIARHELRTPLNAIVGFGRLVAESLPADDQARGPADEMLAAALRLNDKLSDMMLCLDLESERLAPAPTVEQPAAIFEDCLPQWRKRAAAAGVDLSFHDESESAEVTVDQAHLLGMVTRLIDNAIVHAKGARLIAIRLHMPKPSKIAITVADDGPGMEPDTIALCLEAFAQGNMSATRAGEGLGLGLRIVGRLAALYDGHLDLTSPGLGSGCTVTITLPTTVSA